MKNVWEVCTFSDEIMTGNLELHQFAVELYDLITGDADPVYLLPSTFFKNTYLTSEMKGILKDVLLRLELGVGNPAIVIDTGFGGGKTHTLVLLYHILSNPDSGFEYIKSYNLDAELGLEKISPVRTIAIDCRDIKRNTLWGEVADRLGKYQHVKPFDEAKTPIHNMDTIKSLFNEPTLLMIDELPSYLRDTLGDPVGETTLSKLTEGFIYKLIPAIASTNNSVLIITLTEKQQLYKDTVDAIKEKISRVEETLNGLKESLSRKTTIINPVSKEEIYDVIRHRLVKEIDPEEKKVTLNKYVEYYTDQGLLTDPKFVERLEKSYPLHPDLIDLLYERVSTISKFNQTRGTLKLLALVLHDIASKKNDCTLVTTSDVDLAHPQIVSELTSKLDRNDYRKIIEADCIEHAGEIDRTKNIKVVENVAKTIYIHSLHETPSKRSGITAAQIRHTIGHPGLDSRLVEKALNDILQRFWYIKENNREYYFVNAVNDNAIIAEHVKYIDKVETEAQIKKCLEDNAGGTFKPFIWSDNVPDDPHFKLLVFHYEKKDVLPVMTYTLNHQASGSPRRFQNTIVFLYADPDRITEMVSCAREVLAIIAAKKDERVKADKTFLHNITAKLETANASLIAACMRAYCNMGYPDGPEPRVYTMSHEDMSNQKIGGMVVESLKARGKMVTELGHEAIRIDTYKKVEDVYNEFLYDKRQKFIEMMVSLKPAISNGVKNGSFGYSKELVERDGTYEGIISQDTSVDFSGYVINKDRLSAPPPHTLFCQGQVRPMPRTKPTIRRPNSSITFVLTVPIKLKLPLTP